jgi:AraC-like DNA-binding protein
VRIHLVESGNPALASWLIGYLGAATNAVDAPVWRAIPARPNCFVQIVLDGSHGMHDVESGEELAVPQVALFGPLTHYRYDMTISGSLRTFSARLQPAAAGKLFGIDPKLLIDRFVPVSLPPGMLEAVTAAADWAAMARIADGWLSGLCAGRPDSDPVSHSARVLREQRGQVGIHELAEAVGLSLRHFQRRFLVLTGLNPKHYARICRVSHAVHRKQLEPDAAWTALAQEAGYSDQSHFIRDFKALTGTLPNNFLRGQASIQRHPKWAE